MKLYARQHGLGRVSLQHRALDEDSALIRPHVTGRRRTTVAEALREGGSGRRADLVLILASVHQSETTTREPDRPKEPTVTRFGT